jgi:alginate O-acetyltransferase complex protein AlgI
MSLGTWFRDYVYIPLGGSRCSVARNLLNIFIVWMLTGFWHGAEWTFIVWGLYFGILLMLEKTILLKWLERIPVLGHVYIFVFGIISFVIFDAVSIVDAAEHILAMFGGTGLPVMTGITMYYLRSYAVMFIIAIIGATPIPKMLFEKVNGTGIGNKILLVLEPIAMILIVVVATSYLVDGSFNPFLYFRF